MSMDEKDELVKYTLSKIAEAPQLVKNQLWSKNGFLKYRRVYFRIKKYVDNFLEDKDETNRIIFLPGLRGVGKTTVVLQIYDYLRNQRKIEQDRILYFSTDELKAYLGKRILDVVDTFIREVHKTSPVYLEKKLFVFVDESHFDDKWSETAKIFFDKSKKIFMIFTGSSALSMELNVDAVRRMTKEVVFPLNFSEYLTLKHKEWYPPKDTAEAIRDLIFHGDQEWSLKVASEKEDELVKNLMAIEKPIEKEWEDFICYKGFPFALSMDEAQAYGKTFSLIDRIIEKDIFSVKSFNTDTRNTITRILSFLALQPPGSTSDVKLSQRMGVSPTIVRNILDVLEKTHLVFSIKPYAGAGRVARKPWKYYFLCPSINSSIRFKLGAFNRDSITFGILLENLVASYLFRMKETVNLPTAIFYDSSDEVDFLIKDGEDNIIPIEVGYGEKDKRNVERAIKKYNSKYGIIVCNCPKIKKEGNVIYIPFMTFSFV